MEEVNQKTTRAGAGTITRIVSASVAHFDRQRLDDLCANFCGTIEEFKKALGQISKDEKCKYYGITENLVRNEVKFFSPDQFCEELNEESYPECEWIKCVEFLDESSQSVSQQSKEEPAKKEYFDIPLSISREDLEHIGFDAEQISDDEIEDLAQKMADAYLDNGYWIDMKVLADLNGYPKKDEEE